MSEALTGVVFVLSIGIGQLEMFAKADLFESDLGENEAETICSGWKRSAYPVHGLIVIIFDRVRCTECENLLLKLIFRRAFELG